MTERLGLRADERLRRLLERCDALQHRSARLVVASARAIARAQHERAELGRKHGIAEDRSPDEPDA